MASEYDEFTRSLLDENLEVKGVVDKLFKETFTEMRMHSYYTSGLNFVTDVRRLFNHCTIDRSMTMPLELFTTTLENGIKRRMPITWGTLSCLELVRADAVAVVIAASAEGNYLYTTRSATSSSSEDESGIGSDGEDEVRRSIKMTNDEDLYIYKLRVERADRKRNIYTQAEIKDVSTQTWADLGAKESTYEIWHDDEDWEVIKAHGRKACPHEITSWNVEDPDEKAERSRQAGTIRRAGEQGMLQIYSSDSAGSSSSSSLSSSSSSSSSSENVHSSISHVSEEDMRGFRTYHFSAEVTTDMEQHSRGPSCFRCGDLSHVLRNCDVASGDESVKQRADQFSKIEKASYKRESAKREKKNKKRYKNNVSSGYIPTNNMMSLIDNSKISKFVAV